MPAPPKIVMPEPEEAPVYVDDERDEEAEAELKKVEKRRKGRRSTILTGSGLNEIEDQNINKKSLIG